MLIIFQYSSGTFQVSLHIQYYGSLSESVLITAHTTYSIMIILSYRVRLLAVVETFRSFQLELWLNRLNNEGGGGGERGKGERERGGYIEWEEKEGRRLLKRKESWEKKDGK